jgi:endonuclease III
VPKLLSLASALDALKAHRDAQEGPPTADPFELILMENVAYLATPERRREAFDLLKSTVGLHPKDILGAKEKTLLAVTGKGILKDTFLEKLRTCARICLDRFDGDLAAATAGPLPAAKKALRAFPGIGEPGAERILLFMGRLATLAPESNGLRVLVRLGLVREGASYAATYAASRGLEKALPAGPAALREAHLLLQLHGRTLCTRKAPACDRCPLAHGCDHAAKA